jgi:hypothetical protein
VRALIAGLSLLLPAVAGASLNEEVLRKEHECRAQARSFEEHRICTIKVTPRKCRHHVRGKRPEQSLSMSHRQAWLSCIVTCENAGLYSHLIGECSTPSDPSK